MRTVGLTFPIVELPKAEAPKEKPKKTTTKSK
jgi:hypothetical protein